MNASSVLKSMRSRYRIEPLQFPDAEEMDFVVASKPARLRHFMGSGVVALVTFNLFLLSDWMMVPDCFGLALRLRLLVLTPVALLILLVGHEAPRVVLALPGAFLEWVVMSTGICAALCLTAILMLTDSPWAGMYRCGLLPILVYGTLVQRFRFRHAMIFSACVVALHLTSVFFCRGSTPTLS